MDMQCLLIFSQMPPEIAGEKADTQRLYEAVNVLLYLQVTCLFNLNFKGYNQFGDICILVRVTVTFVQHFITKRMCGICSSFISRKKEEEIIVIATLF